MPPQAQTNRALSPGAPGASDSAAADRIMQKVAQTAKTESAFYLRFQTLPHADRKFLAAYYNLPDNDWSVFKQITRWWGVHSA